MNAVKSKPRARRAWQDDPDVIKAGETLTRLRADLDGVNAEIAALSNKHDNTFERAAALLRGENVDGQSHPTADALHDRRRVIQRAVDLSTAELTEARDRVARRIIAARQEEVAIAAHAVAAAASDLLAKIAEADALTSDIRRDAGASLSPFPAFGNPHLFAMLANVAERAERLSNKGR